VKHPIVHPEVVLGLPKGPHTAVVTAAGAIIAAVDGNLNFPNSAVQVAAAKVAEAAYAKAVTDAGNKIPGAVTVRTDAKVALLKALAPLRVIAQTAVDAHLDQAGTIAESAKMKLRKVAVHTKADFAVDDGLGTGQVHLVARAILKALLYFWEVSLDQKVWNVALDTSSAQAVIAGLTVGQTYYFRFRARTRKAMGDYSQILSHVVR
jgi:hypothetical protein